MDEACTTVEHLGGENPVVAPDHVAQVGMCPLYYFSRKNVLVFELAFSFDEGCERIDRNPFNYP
jgi:hypothetical protein